MENENKNIEEKQQETIPTIKLEEAKEGESNEGYYFPWAFAIIFGILVLAIIACVIVILCTGGPIE